MSESNSSKKKSSKSNNDNSDNEKIKALDYTKLSHQDLINKLKRIATICEGAAKDTNSHDISNRVIVIADIVGVDLPDSLYRSSYNGKAETKNQPKETKSSKSTTISSTASEKIDTDTPKATKTSKKKDDSKKDVKGDDKEDKPKDELPSSDMGLIVRPATASDQEYFEDDDIDNDDDDDDDEDEENDGNGGMNDFGGVSYA